MHMQYNLEAGMGRISGGVLDGRPEPIDLLSGKMRCFAIFLSMASENHNQATVLGIYSVSRGVLLSTFS